MKKNKLLTSMFIGVLGLSLSGCGSTPAKDGEVVATGAGAGIGFVLGNAISDNFIVKAGLGLVGGFVGNAIYNDLNKEFAAESGVEIDKVTINGIEAVKFKTPVHFASNSYSVVDADALRINAVKKVIQDKTKSLLIVGHTDSDGSTSYNQTLSEKRAGAIKSLFLGVGTDDIKAVGKGETAPIVANDSLQNKQLNRRVEIFIFPNQD